MEAQYIESLKQLGACYTGSLWAQTFETVQGAWNKCERPDWMLWLLIKCSANKAKMFAAGCDCATLALPFVEERFRPAAMHLIEKVRLADGDYTGGARMEIIDAISEVDAARAHLQEKASREALYGIMELGRASVYRLVDLSDVPYSVALARLSSDRFFNGDPDITMLRECADIVRLYFPAAPDVLAAVSGTGGAL